MTHQYQHKSTTSRVIHVNLRTSKELEKKLRRLEKERKAALRELNNESRQFLNSSSCKWNTDFSSQGFQKSPGSASGELYGWYSPRDVTQTRLLSRSLETMATAGARSPTPRSSSYTSVESSPSSSPESKKRLLINRRPSNEGQMNIESVNGRISTARKYSSVGHDNVGEIRGGSLINIPQIVVSAEEYPREDNPKVVTENETMLQLPVNGYENKQSLSPTPRRNRSSSVPSIFPPVSYLESSTATQNFTGSRDNLIFKEKKSEIARPRSNSISVSFASISRESPRVNTPRRKSLSVERRATNRRSSFTVDQLIQDLARGIDHMDMYNRANILPPEEWEKLKDCRYLRLPNPEKG
ncbi:uncharacterized protein LOC131934777 [Physella acuta]|uniref:uncharacterized protein LOC131934777 n=1 Tax=Physella acuta TaxID=109671 RepID=UPI0027DC2B41|nr:uncharacterized protein LOC131934777 [Physella acuta]